VPIASTTASARIVVAALGLEREIPFGAGDRGDLGVVAHVDLVPAGLLVPGPEHYLALAGIEIEIGAQHQVAGRRHHVLALLVLVDRVREVVGLLDQHVAQAELRGMRSPR
jgi:hypothetical protein